MQVNLCKALVAVATIAAAPPAFADAITDWNENAVTLATPRMPPPAAQRAVAIVQVAMFDAVNSIERRYRPYLVQLPVASTASKEAAAAAAAVQSPEFVPAMIEAPISAPKEEQTAVEPAPLIGFDLDGASAWVCPGAEAGMVTAIIRALKASK